jgi:hypothetical protein
VGRDGDDTQRQQQIQHGDGADGVPPNFMNDFVRSRDSVSEWRRTSDTPYPERDSSIPLKHRPNCQAQVPRQLRFLYFCSIADNMVCSRLLHPVLVLQTLTASEGVKWLRPSFLCYT